MKTLRTLLTAIIALVAVAISSQASAQTSDLTLEQKKAAVNVVKQQLPMVASEGVTWTTIDMDWSKHIVTLRFEIDPKGLGLSLKDAKYGFSSMSSDAVRGLVKDFIDSMKIIGARKAVLIMAFPDKTSVSYEFAI